MLRLISLLILLSATVLNGQIEPHIIDGSSSRQLDIENYFISEVIDSRLVKKNIGYVFKGHTNWRAEAMLSLNISDFLINNFNTLIGDSGDPIILIVHEFSISEYIKPFEEIGTFHYHFEFAKRKKGELFSCWNIDSKSETRGLEVTKSHDKRILDELAKIALLFEKKYNEAIDVVPITLNAEPSFNYKQIPQKGLYTTFTKLGNNKPIQKDGFRLIERKNKYPKYQLRDSNRKKIKEEIIFVSDGDHLYIHSKPFCHSPFFTKALDYGRYIYFEAVFEDTYNLGAEGMKGYNRPLLGFGSGVQTLKPLILDTETGLIHILNEKNTGEILKDYPEVLANFNNSRKKVKNIRNAMLSVNDLFRQ